MCHLQPKARVWRLSLETDESAQPSLEREELDEPEPELDEPEPELDEPEPELDEPEPELDEPEPELDEPDEDECMPDFSHETVSDVEDIHELSQQHPDDETFVEDPQVTYDTPVTTYLLVPGASQRGKGKLISSDGYSYTFKRETQTTIHWRCAVRNKNVVCPATVVQTGDVFQPGLPDHLRIHPAHQDAEIRAKITSEIREKAQQQIFEPASNLVDEVMEANADNPGLPSHAALIRRVNRPSIVRPNPKIWTLNLMKNTSRKISWFGTSTCRPQQRQQDTSCLQPRTSFASSHKPVVGILTLPSRLCVPLSTNCSRCTRSSEVETSSSKFPSRTPSCPANARLTTDPYS
ncbi:uncharacterized protein LOC144907193 [Branchiostoma floridae x Branchiostoma belcheri]